jgi:hypothetical protein
MPHPTRCDWLEHGPPRRTPLTWRATKREADGLSFFEADHLDGDVDVIAVLKALLAENRRRPANSQIVFRPDHGHRMLDDLAARPCRTARHHPRNPAWRLIRNVTPATKIDERPPRRNEQAPATTTGRSGAGRGGRSIALRSLSAFLIGRLDCERQTQFGLLHDILDQFLSGHVGNLAGEQPLLRQHDHPVQRGPNF